VAKIAADLPPDTRKRWVSAALAHAPNGRRVVDRLAPHLDCDEARTYLARLIVPADMQDKVTLIQAINQGLPVARNDEDEPTAAALARRLGELGQGAAAYALLRLGRDDGVTLSGLVEVAPHLSRDEVLDIEERLLSTTVRYLTVAGDGYRLSNISPSYLGGRLAPALARVGEVRRALAHCAAADAERERVDAYLGVADWTEGETRSKALNEAIVAVRDLRDVFRRDQLGPVGEAVGRDPAVAASAWPDAVKWASAHPRDEAISMLASFAPVAATVGGTALVDETFDAVERVLHWWP
jgi:hypothetical protein